MKKFISGLLIATLCALSLAGCGSGTPKDPFASLQDFKVEGYIQAPETIYHTEAQENGLENTVMYVDGSVNKVETVEGAPFCTIDTKQGQIGIMKALYNADWDKLVEGKNVRVYFAYAGMSGKLNLPVGYYIGLVDPLQVPDEVPSDLAEAKRMFESIDSPSPSASQEPTTTPTPDGTAWKAEGMYKVGTDIPAGEYLLQATSFTSAYYCVSKDSSGELSSIEANDNFAGTAYVTVKEGQYLEIKRAKFVAVENAPVLCAQDGKYLEGMYKVGRDLPAGEYKAICDGDISAYVEITKSSAGGLRNIVSNDNFDGEKYVTVKNGQYIKINRGYLVAN